MGGKDKDDWSGGGVTPGAVASHDTVTHHDGETTYEHHEYGVTPGAYYSGYSLTVGDQHTKNAAKDFGAAEDATRWDLHSLDQTITWLNDMHTYMNNLYRNMPDLMELTGRASENSHFGTFSSATSLWQKHKQLYDSFIKMFEQVMSELQDAATATGQLKKNYDAGEQLNHANVAAIEKAFSDASNSNGNSPTGSSATSTPSGDGF